ncbi:MAG: LysR family transcriptional regulator, partial [Gammaproteobacteria bacterium]|nr:LysR family transcriptional regulator [Gammaproteobacteria bacterium]
MIDLYRLNLNLLVALDVLLAEQSVTQAAKKLFMTQAAMSNNLQQLREIFKDELLIREKNRMTPTSYATSLQSRLHEILEELRSV